MALRKSTSTGLRLLLRQQELYGGLPWQSVSRELHDLSTRQLLPACCALLHPQRSLRPCWHGDDWREAGDRRYLHGSHQLWQSAQPAVASLTEDEEQSGRDQGQAGTSGSSQPQSAPERKTSSYNERVAALRRMPSQARFPCSVRPSH
jgi:hypothetical protein